MPDAEILTPPQPHHEPHVLTYYSSQTESLVEALLHQLRTDVTSPINTPFGHAQILVPNSGMQRYLELKIAKEFSICSHIDISYIGQLLAQTYREWLASDFSAHIDERLLTFALLHLWDKQIFPLDSDFNKIFQQHKQPRQRYLFATRIAKLLRQYLNERPAMIDRWQAGKLDTKHMHEAWQRDLCEKLIGVLSLENTSRRQLQKHFAHALRQPQSGHDSVQSLPRIIHVFGFHAIPATQLSDLLAMGQATQMTFYTFNPSVAYWQDIVPEKVKKRLEITQTDEAKLLTVGHPLLASWGQSGKYLIEQLNEFDTHNLDTLVPPAPPHSLLTWLQNDIRTLGEAQNNDAQHLFDSESASESLLPYSISLHACANPRREIEVLYDNLCHLFEQGVLNPADVLVIVPKLGEYAPHIQAIFAKNPDQFSVPYSLANQSSAETEPDVQAFLSLLDTIDNDFQAQALFDTLSEARVQAALSLSQSHLDNLRHWLLHSHYSRHFFDNNHGESSSLEKLLDSLLLAYVGGEDTALGNRRASPHYHGGQQEALVQLTVLWQRFAQFVGLKHKKQTLDAWFNELRQLSETFLPQRHNMDTWLNDWHEAVTTSALDNQTAYDFTTIRTDLSTLLQSDMLHGPFLSGGVSFCAVVPMRSIPAKLIAILGLNNDFPAIGAKDPLDLRLARPLWSDKNLHKEQQYFFLETLMAAREKLYLSHVGVNEKTGESIPPSALVRELFAYLSRHVPAFESTVCKSYPLQGFVSTDSFQTLYATPVTREKSTSNTVATPVSLPESLTANQLADMLIEPLMAYWRYHLGATPLAESEPLATHEFIATENGLDRWQYKQGALNATLHPSLNVVIDDLQQRNLYAPQTISAALLSRANDEIAPLAEALKTWVSSTPLHINETLKIPFDRQATYLQINAEAYENVGMLHYHTGEKDIKKFLRVWINHAIYHALPEAIPQPSILLTLDKGKTTQTLFPPLATHASAQQTVEKLLTFAHRMIQYPYPVKLCLSNKKAPSVVHYEAVDYTLYSEIEAVNEVVLSELQLFWAEMLEK